MTGFSRILTSICHDTPNKNDLIIDLSAVIPSYARDLEESLSIMLARPLFSGDYPVVFDKIVRMELSRQTERGSARV